MTEATKRGCRAIGAAWLAVLLAGCGGGGGSGSTGLVTSEVDVIDDVRSGGTCEEFDATPYCATDSPNAVAPGGQSVSVIGTAVPTPVRTASPAPVATATVALSPTPGPDGTPTAGGAPTSTPAKTSGLGTRTPPPATPRPSPSPGDSTTVRLQVDGFAEGAACATAARPVASDDDAEDVESPWTTADLVPLDPPDAVIVFPLPTSVKAPRDTALLCFDDPPAELASELETLTDAAPTVVFVLP